MLLGVIKMTLEKIAELAEVSIGTVSKAFSGSKEISIKTKNKIYNIAKENNVFEKYYKIKREKKLIAVICPEIISEYYTEIVTLIEKELFKYGMIMTLSFSSFSSKKESELISYFISTKCVDGIIVVAAQSQIKFNSDMPIVAVNTRRNISEVDCINAAYKNTIIETIKYLKDLGHKNIAFVGETYTKRRQSFFNNALNVNGLRVNNDWIFTEKSRFQKAGIDAMEKILKLKEKPTAIFCAYDNIALGVIQTAHANGFRVPEDFSVVGVNDIPISSYYNVSLTTLKSNNDKICELAVDLMRKKLDNKFYSLRKLISLPSALIIRNTVQKIN